MRKKKGFTLMELVIVITIFGVLVAVITPTWAHFLSRSKTRSQNQKAKTIFNAAQTALIDLEFAERKYMAVYKDGSSSVSEKTNAKNKIYSDPDSTRWYYFWDGTRGYRCDNKGLEIGYGSETEERKAFIQSWNNTFASKVNRIIDEDVMYKIEIRDYKVVSVASANNIHDRYLGGHPTSIIDLKANGVDTNSGTSDVEHTNVKAIDLGWFDLDVANNPSQVNAS